MKNVLLKVKKRKLKNLDQEMCSRVFGATSGGGLDPKAQALRSEDPGSLLLIP
jgi:hypothetical protein